MRRIYLDHNATTRPHPMVRAAMAASLLDENFGNPSSVHAFGRAARDRVERSRAQVAAFLGAEPEEVVFTSGGTEGNNLAIRGAAHAARASTGRSTVVSSPIEHPAVRDSLESLRREGFRIRLVPVDKWGAIALADLGRLLDGDVALCSFAAANHEIGNQYPIVQIAGLAHAAGALVHTDAVQAAGRVPLDVRALGVDLATISSHKLYGPKGVGAIYVRRDLPIEPVVVGGHQEKGRRPGTENVPGIVGFGQACDVVARELLEWIPRIAALRDRLEEGALAIRGSRRFGAFAGRVPGTASLGFDGVPGEVLMANLDLEGVAVATGAACSSGSLDPSPVILALGFPREEALLATRFSLGWETTERDVDDVVRLLPAVVERIRKAHASAS